MPFNKNMSQLGRKVANVEVDESLMVLLKYMCCYFPVQTWVFGVVVRESRRCFIQIVPDKSRKTLKKSIKKIVIDATIIISEKSRVMAIS